MVQFVFFARNYIKLKKKRNTHKRKNQLESWLVYVKGEKTPVVFIKKPGSYLLSHGRAAVPSALGRFTSVFGKGTGISTLLWPPGDHMGHRVSMVL